MNATTKRIPFEAARAAAYIASAVKDADDAEPVTVSCENRESCIKASDLRALLLILYPDGKVTL